MAFDILHDLAAVVALTAFLSAIWVWAPVVNSTINALFIGF